MPTAPACDSSMSTSRSVKSRRGANRNSKATRAASSFGHHSTTCVTVSGASPQRQSGVTTSGTLRKSKNALSPILLVLACTSKALSCFRKSACLCRASLIFFDGDWSGLAVRARLTTVDTRLGTLLLRVCHHPCIPLPTAAVRSLSEPESAARGRATSASLVVSPDRRCYRCWSNSALPFDCRRASKTDSCLSSEPKMTRFLVCEFASR